MGCYYPDRQLRIWTQGLHNDLRGFDSRRFIHFTEFRRGLPPPASGHDRTCRGSRSWQKTCLKHSSRPLRQTPAGKQHELPDREFLGGSSMRDRQRLRSRSSPTATFGEFGVQTSRTTAAPSLPPSPLCQSTGRQMISARTAKTLSRQKDLFQPSLVQVR